MIIALGVMITIHELGHYLAAKFFGVRILKFSIGFGKPIAEYERNGTKFRISAIPLGGYVKMQGENPSEQNDPDMEDSPALDTNTFFSHKAWWQKAVIGFAGPFANLLLGLLLFIVAFILPQKMEDSYPVIHSASGKWAEVFCAGDSLVSLNNKPIIGFNKFLIDMSQTDENHIHFLRDGVPIQLTISKTERDSLIKSLKPMANTVLGEVFSGLPAWQAGLKPGDIVVSVDSVIVSDWYDMRNKIVTSPKDSVVLELLRKDQALVRKIALQQNLTSGEERMIGISQFLPVKQNYQYTPLEAVRYGFLYTTGFISMNYSGLFRIVKKPSQLKSNVGGPVMLASMAQEIGKRSLSSLILFFGSISLILMIMNLLPIPILDGGLIMFSFIEGIIRHPIPVKVQALAQRIGFVLLIWLMIFAFYTDISKLVFRIMALK